MVQAVYLVDEEDVTLLEVREYGRKVAGPLDRGSRSRVELRPHLVRHDACKRRLAQSRRTREDDVVKGLVSFLCRLNQDAEVLPHALLPAVVVQRLWSQSAVYVEVVRGELRCDRPGARLVHAPHPCRSRILEQVVPTSFPHGLCPASEPLERVRQHLLYGRRPRFLVALQRELDLLRGKAHGEERVGCLRLHRKCGNGSDNVAARWL